MKKRIFGIISVLMIATMMVAGCNGAEPTSQEPESASPILSVDDTQPVIIEPAVSEPDDPEPPVEEPSETQKPEDTSGDPNLACLEVSEEFAMQNKCLCVYRKGHLYSLGPYVPYENAEQYFIGQVVDNSKARLMINKRGTDENLTVSDDPFVYLVDGDELRDYNGTYLGFSRVEFQGYTLTMWENKEDKWLFLLPYINKDPIRLETWNIDQFEIRDENGNLIRERIDLKQDAKYMVSWYAGVDYHEQEMWAETQLYRYEDNSDGSWNGINVSNELTKDGYAIVHWKEINEPGIYMPIGTTGDELTLPFRIN